MNLNKFFARLSWLLLCSLWLSGCGGGGGAADSNTIASPLNTTSTLANVLNVSVNAGPTGNSVNRLYTQVTLCQPGNSNLCQTIDHVLVDTGSTGLRILASVLEPRLNLNRVQADANVPLLNCAQFVDNTFAWGPMVSADVWLGGKTAPNMALQVIGDAALARLGNACSYGSALNSVASLGANGIIGLGLFKEDCGERCTRVPNNGFYFRCTDASCSASTPSTARLSQQLKQPVALFSSDNNGLFIDLPSVGSAGATRLDGTLTFGIGTQANNPLGSNSVVLAVGSTGWFTTLLDEQLLNHSFIDTGSNGLYFDSAHIPSCASAQAAGFYCPNALTPLSANLSASNALKTPVSFAIDNALALFANRNNAVLPTLSGPLGDAQTFDWGLPFFYGRRVFLGLEGSQSNSVNGPFYAF